MKVRIVGKRVMKGNSKKTGNPYHFTEVHFLIVKSEVEDSACEIDTVQATMCAPENILVGTTCEVEYDKDGHMLSFAPCK